VGIRPRGEGEEEAADLIDTVALLQSSDVHGASVIGAYHVRGVAPLMAHTLSVYEMTPDAPLEGTVHARGPYRNGEIEQRIGVAMNVLGDMFKFLIPGHPVMCPDVVSSIWSLLGSLSWLTPHCRSIQRAEIYSLASSFGPLVHRCQRMQPSG
jgi:hypothetical protein